MAYFRSQIMIVFFLMLFTTGGYASSVADSLIVVLNKTSDPKLKAQLLIDISRAIEQKESQKALEYAREAEKSSSSFDDQSLYCKALLQQAKIYYILSDLQNAMNCAVKAKETAENAGLELELALSLDAIGVIWYEIGDEGKSSECFFKSLRIYEKLNDRKGLGQTYCRIGTLYYNQKENKKAVEYYRLSIDLARKLKNNEGIASNIHNLATVYTSENKIDSALPLYYEALQINRKAGNSQLLGSNYMNISSLYLKQGKYDSAMKNVLRANEIFTRLGNQVRIAKARIVEGEIWYALKQYDNGITSAAKALDISMKNRFREIIPEAGGVLEKLYLAKGDSIRAYRYSVIEHNWKDSISIGENKKSLAKLEMQYMFDKREQQMRIEKQRKNFFLILLSIISVFSILLIILLRSRYKLKEKKAALEKKSLELDLEYKKKELTTNVMALMKKNEMLSEITQKIIRLKKESQQEETKLALKKIINDLQKSTDEEILKEFSLRFREVHSEFYDTLLKKYPMLTPSEMKLCAFLRLNMTTKEIAELTGQQISSLENARYRLRQKLGINSSDTNLVTFLTQIS